MVAKQAEKNSKCELEEGFNKIADQRRQRIGNFKESQKNFSAATPMHSKGLPHPCRTPSPALSSASSFNGRKHLNLEAGSACLTAPLEMRSLSLPPINDQIVQIHCRTPACSQSIHLEVGQQDRIPRERERRGHRDVQILLDIV